MSSPLRRTSPASCAPGTDSCIRFKIRRKVDLPQPDGPMRAVTVAAGIDSDTSSRTWVPPNHAETSMASTRAPPRQGSERPADESEAQWLSTLKREPPVGRLLRQSPLLHVLHK